MLWEYVLPAGKIHRACGRKRVLKEEGNISGWIVLACTNVVRHLNLHFNLTVSVLSSHAVADNFVFESY